MRIKLLKKCSSIKTHLTPAKEKVVDVPKLEQNHLTIDFDLFNLDLNNQGDIDKIYERVDSVKLTVSKYIEKLEERGPKLEDLEASCVKLSEQTKDLELVSRATKKIYYDEKLVKFKLICVFFILIALILSSIYITAQK